MPLMKSHQNCASLFYKCVTTYPLQNHDIAGATYILLKQVTNCDDVNCKVTESKVRFLSVTSEEKFAIFPFTKVAVICKIGTIRPNRLIGIAYAWNMFRKERQFSDYDTVSCGLIHITTQPLAYNETSFNIYVHALRM